MIFQSVFYKVIFQDSGRNVSLPFSAILFAECPVLLNENSYFCALINVVERMDVAIVKYNAGNIYSVDYALKRLGITPVVTGDPELLSKADKVIFPGVGEARSTMDYLQEHKLDDLTCGLKQPVLGICLGMQLMCRYSEERDRTCLGIFDTDVKLFKPERHEDKVPHMGWNNLANVRTSLFTQAEEKQYVYFVHSYYVPVNKFTAATTDYIHPFSAALHRDNFYATQFHPEKSGSVGERILKNFLTL